MKNTTEDDKKIVALAKKFVLSILLYEEPTASAFRDAYDIKSGDKKLLLAHLKAIQNIINKAIDILGENNE